VQWALQIKVDLQSIGTTGLLIAQGLKQVGAPKVRSTY